MLEDTLNLESHIRPDVRLTVRITPRRCQVNLRHILHLHIPFRLQVEEKVDPHPLHPLLLGRNPVLLPRSAVSRGVCTASILAKTLSYPSIHFDSNYAGSTGNAALRLD